MRQIKPRVLYPGRENGAEAASFGVLRAGTREADNSSHETARPPQCAIGPRGYGNDLDVRQQCTGDALRKPGSGTENAIPPT